MSKDAKLNLMFGLTPKQMFEVHEEVVRYELYSQLLSLLEWRCEPYSKEYTDEMYALFDLDEAADEGLRLWNSGCDDISYIKDTVFSRRILICEKQMNVKE